MSTHWPRARLGEVVSHRKEFVTIDDLQNYKRPRVQLHARGIVLRDEVPGALIKTKKQQVSRAGEFLVAEIDAKVGGFGIVPPELDGAIVSSHYYLFSANDEKLDRRFLDWFIKTPAFREQVKAQGSTNYAAIRPADVLNYEIPLPPLPEQRRIVARIEALAAQIHEARSLRHQAAVVAQTLAARSTESVFAKVSERMGSERLGEHVKLQGGYAFKSDEYIDVGLPIVRIANLENQIVHTEGSPSMGVSRLEEFRRFILHPGDILVAMTGATTQRFRKSMFG